MPKKKVQKTTTTLATTKDLSSILEMKLTKSELIDLLMAEVEEKLSQERIQFWNQLQKCGHELKTLVPEEAAKTQEGKELRKRLEKIFPSSEISVSSYGLWLPNEVYVEHNKHQIPYKKMAGNVTAVFTHHSSSGCVESKHGDYDAFIHLSVDMSQNKAVTTKINEWMALACSYATANKKYLLWNENKKTAKMKILKQLLTSVKEGKELLEKIQTTNIVNTMLLGE